MQSERQLVLLFERHNSSLCWTAFVPANPIGISSEGEWNLQEQQATLGLALSQMV